MEIINGFPPIWENILVAFPDIARHKPIFAYGDAIYNPFEREMLSEIIFHESIHIRQQGEFPEAWWMQYLTDADFRFGQELEAYGEQYAFVKRTVLANENLANHSNRILKSALASMAQALSGESYGSMISFGEAESQIKKFAKNIVVG